MLTISSAWQEDTSDVMPIKRTPIIPIEAINMIAVKMNQKKSKQEAFFFTKDARDAFVSMFKDDWIKSGDAYSIEKGRFRGPEGQWIYDIKAKINPKYLIEFYREVNRYEGVTP